ncbi:carbon-nitrogen hydrolase family protein [Campylobacter sp. MOP51]|uniref:carbon-nitrogen hydrolase family protein n=1 Tax=Campylobacter canis TaxID=3378588 RepID=UPI003C448E6B
MTISNEICELNLVPVTLFAKDYEDRLKELANFIKNTPSNSLILASELCISGYDFDGLLKSKNDTSALDKLDSKLIKKLKEALEADKFLGFTHLTSFKHEDSAKKQSQKSQQRTKIYNEFLLLNSAEIFHKQAKHKLFKPNLEDEKFDAGGEEGIRIFEFYNIKIGVLICFELRFAEFWVKLQECDIILAPAMWGKAREEAYMTLCKALAIVNNCFVVASSSLDLEFSGVFLPSGEFKKEVKFDKNLIVKARQSIGK